MLKSHSLYDTHLLRVVLSDNVETLNSFGGFKSLFLETKVFRHEKSPFKNELGESSEDKNVSRARNRTIHFKNHFQYVPKTFFGAIGFRNASLEAGKNGGQKWNIFFGM